MLTKNKNLFQYYLTLSEIRKELKEVNLDDSVELNLMLKLVGILCVTCPLTAIIDYFVREEKSFFTFWCSYVPVFSLKVYFLFIAAVFDTCTKNFEILNRRLEDLTMKNLSLQEKFQLFMEDSYPFGEKNFFDSPNELKKIFVLHNKIFSFVERFNDILRFELLCMVSVNVIASLNFFYTICVDTMRVAYGIGLSRNSIAADYWGILGFFGMKLFYDNCNNLKNQAKRARLYLHDIKSLYPRLIKQVRIS